VPKSLLAGSAHAVGKHRTYTSRTFALPRSVVHPPVAVSYQSSEPGKSVLLVPRYTRSEPSEAKLVVPIVAPPRVLEPAHALCTLGHQNPDDDELRRAVEIAKQRERLGDLRRAVQLVERLRPLVFDS
jgi:hypothetical protein